MDEGTDSYFERGGEYCAMSNCFNHNRQKSSRSFFRFPTDLNVCAQWILLSGRKDLIERLETKGPAKLNNGSLRYCSDHFSPATFKNNVLKRNAIPTRHLGNANAIQQQTPEPMKIYGLNQTWPVKPKPNGPASRRKLRSPPPPSPEKMQIIGLYPAFSVKLEPDESTMPRKLPTPPRLAGVQISGLYQACSNTLHCNGSPPPPMLQTPIPRLGEVQISELYESCSTALHCNGSPPPPMLLTSPPRLGEVQISACPTTLDRNESLQMLPTPPTLSQSQSDPVPIGSARPEEILQQMGKTLKLENQVQTLRQKLRNVQKQMSKLRRKGEEMKNENLVLKSQIVSYNENLIDISPAAMGNNILAALLRHGQCKPKGRRYTESEKKFAWEFYRTSQKAYGLVHKRLNLPTPRMMNQEVHRHRKAVLSVINDTAHAPEDEEAISQNDTSNAQEDELRIAVDNSYILEEAIPQNDTTNAQDDELRIAVDSYNSYILEEAIPQNDTTNASEDELNIAVVSYNPRRCYTRRIPKVAIPQNDTANDDELNMAVASCIS